MMKETRKFEQNPYWAKKIEQIQNALEVIDKEGWDTFRVKFKNKLDFTDEENRADWRFFLPLDHNSRVLDAGAGLGRISIPLARVVKEVVACDSSSVRIKFLKKLAEAKGLNNIKTIVADIFNLPFEEESFDLIVMNGLLEWVGKTDLYKDPREAQIACLKAFKKLLKKGGHLYVGIENRFALAYLRGIDHSGLRFTSFLPRWLADKYTIFRTGQRYDTYTYNISGYKTLFKESGFENPDFYLVYPGYNLPRIIVPYQDLNLLKYVITAMMPSNTLVRRIAKIAARSSLLTSIYRKFFFSFNIFAQK